MGLLDIPQGLFGVIKASHLTAKVLDGSIEQVTTVTRQGLVDDVLANVDCMRRNSRCPQHCKGSCQLPDLASLKRKELFRPVLPATVIAQCPAARMLAASETEGNAKDDDRQEANAPTYPQMEEACRDSVTRKTPADTSATGTPPTKEDTTTETASHARPQDSAPSSKSRPDALSVCPAAQLLSGKRRIPPENSAADTLPSKTAATEPSQAAASTKAAGKARRIAAVKTLGRFIKSLEPGRIEVRHKALAGSSARAHLLRRIPGSSGIVLHFPRQEAKVIITYSDHSLSQWEVLLLALPIGEFLLEVEEILSKKR